MVVPWCCGVERCCWCSAAGLLLRARVLRLLLLLWCLRWCLPSCCCCCWCSASAWLLRLSRPASIKSVAVLLPLLLLRLLPLWLLPLRLLPLRLRLLRLRLQLRLRLRSW